MQLIEAITARLEPGLQVTTDLLVQIIQEIQVPPSCSSVLYCTALQTPASPSSSFSPPSCQDINLFTSLGQQ